MSARIGLLAVAALTAVAAGPIFPHLSGGGIEKAVHSAQLDSSRSLSHSPRSEPSWYSAQETSRSPSPPPRTSSRPTENAPPSSTTWYRANADRAKFLWKERQHLVKDFADKGGWMTERQRVAAVRGEAATKKADLGLTAEERKHPAVAHLFHADGTPLTKLQVAVNAGYDPKLIPRPGDNLRPRPRPRPARKEPIPRAKKPIEALTANGQYRRRQSEAGFPQKSAKQREGEVQLRRAEAQSWLTAHGIPHDADPKSFFRHPDAATREVSHDEELAHFVKATKLVSYLRGQSQAGIIKDYEDMGSRAREVWGKRLRDAKAREGLSSMGTTSSNSGSTDFLPPWGTHPKRPRTQMEVVETIRPHHS